MSQELRRELLETGKGQSHWWQVAISPVLKSLQQIQKLFALNC
jgi:hypothetical protein